MAKQLISYSDKSQAVVQKLNDDFTELSEGTGVNISPVSKDVLSQKFCEDVNGIVADLRSALGATGQQHSISPTAYSVVSIDNMNADINSLYEAKDSGGEEPPVQDEKIKVLFFGNSYTANSVFYLPFILETFDVPIKVAFHFAAGATLKDYSTGFSSSSTVYVFDSDTDTEWSNISRSPERSLLSDNWDLVVIQQASQESVDASTYSFATSLIKKIDDVMKTKNRPYKIGWNINHARSSKNNPLDILQNIQNACSSNNDYAHQIDVVIPYGTAVFNALTKRVSRVIPYGGGANRNFKHSDGVHLSPGVAMYTASLAIAQAISNAINLGISIQDDTTVPLEDWSDDSSDGYKGISPTYGSFVPMTAQVTSSSTVDMRTIAKAAVAAAITTPFAITQLDGEQIEISYNLTKCSINGNTVTSLDYGQELEVLLVPDSGKTFSAISWKLDWMGSVKTIDLTGEVGTSYNKLSGQRYIYTINADGTVSLKFPALTDNIEITAKAS